MILYVSIAVGIGFFIYELFRINKLNDKIERPLHKHYKQWKNEPRAARYVGDVEIKKDYFAYSRFTEEELFHTRIFLKSYDNDSGYLTAVMDFGSRIILPLVTFAFGILFSTTSSLYAIANSRASTDPTVEQELVKIVGLFKSGFDAMGDWIIFMFLAFVITLLNASARVLRKNKLRYHLVIVEEVIEARKGSMKVDSTS